MPFSNDEKLNSAEGLLNQIFIDAPVSPGIKYWYNSSYSWVPIVPPDKIWLEFNSIPSASTSAEADTNASNLPEILQKVTVRLTLDITSNNRAFLARSIFDDHTSDMLNNGILPSLIQHNGTLSSGYSVRLYHGDPNSGGVELPTIYHADTNGAPSWKFNYSSGILQVSTDESSHYRTLYDTNGLYVTFYRYIGATGIDAGTGGSGDGKSVVDTFNCDISTAVGDIVHVSPSSDNYVLTSNDNRSDQVSIGIVKSKPFNNVAEVIMAGKSPAIFSGLEKGKNVYVSESGIPTTTLPTTGYIQIIGVAIAPNRMIINPEYNRIKRNPF